MASQIKESASCEFVDSDVIEIVSADEYDAHRAKLRSSLSWLISKVYGSQPPNDLKDPFYENSEGQLVLRPVMVNLLSSSELYCQACSNMFPETHTQWRGHWSIIQVLSRKGIYIQDIQDTAVTETVLVQTAPFRLKAHLSLMDALMKAYSCEVASVEKVVKAVRNITAFPASSELPGTTEEALTFWVNKVCAALTSDPALSDGQLLEGETAQKVRIVSKSTSPRDPVKVPPMEDLMRDVGDGCNVAALIAYYRPGQLNIRDVCLKDSIGIADSLYNLRQIGQFCRNHLPWRSFHLSYEDLLYTHDSMRVNILTFLADLFYCFEGPGASLANGNPGSIEQDRLEAMPAAGKRSAQTAVPNVPISGATKKSFQRLPFEDTASNLGMGRSSLTSP
ncbi:calmodulin-regulated spectrin-associated protein 1, partial [Aplysia californica]|uniref:Calmodulin-regulated spectrin-associated protein 1 n=1 Tax=Aplysia californica TaxID=6500 RepID=A0ABM1AF76_APLCA